MEAPLPTFFPILAILLAAGLAPLLLLLALLALTRPRTRRFGRWLLSAGGLGAAAILVPVAATSELLAAGLWDWTLPLAAGFGFTVAGLPWLVWRRDREVQAERRRESAPHRPPAA